MDTDSMTDDMQALRRLLPNDTVVTPDALATALGWLLGKLRASSDKAPSQPLSSPAYARKSELCARYNITRNTARQWLDTLEAAGEIHPLQGAPRRPGARGDVLYRIDEVEGALRARRRKYKDS